MSWLGHLTQKWLLQVHVPRRLSSQLRNNIMLQNLCYCLSGPQRKLQKCNKNVACVLFQWSKLQVYFLFFIVAFRRENLSLQSILQYFKGIFSWSYWVMHSSNLIFSKI